MKKRFKTVSIVWLSVSVLCLGLSTYLRSFKQRLPLPKEETEIILAYNQIGLLLKDIGIVFIAVLFFSLLLYVWNQRRHRKKL